jgi:hypothetical protein
VAVLIEELAEGLPYSWMKKNRMKPKNGKVFISCTKIVILILKNGGSFQKVRLKWN